MLIVWGEVRCAAVLAIWWALIALLLNVYGFIGGRLQGWGDDTMLIRPSDERRSAFCLSHRNMTVRAPCSYIISSKTEMLKWHLSNSRHKEPRFQIIKARNCNADRLHAEKWKYFSLFFWRKPLSEECGLSQGYTFMPFQSENASLNLADKTEWIRVKVIH